MKKFLCILLCLLLLAGCGADAAVTKSPEAAFPAVEILEAAPAEAADSDGGYLAYETLALPGGLEYAAAQCLAGERLYVGGLSEDGAVLAWTDLEGAQGTLALPEGAEWILDLCPAEDGFWLLCGSLPRNYPGLGGEHVIVEDPQGMVCLAHYDRDGTLGEALVLAERYPDLQFRQVLPVDGGFLLRGDAILVLTDREGRERERLVPAQPENPTAWRGFRQLVLLDGQAYVLQGPLVPVSSREEDYTLLLLDAETLETRPGPELSCTLYGTGLTADGQWLLNCKSGGQSGLGILDSETGQIQWVYDWHDLGAVLLTGEAVFPWGRGYVLLARYGTEIGLLRWLEGEKPEPVTLTMALTGNNGMELMVRKFNLSQDRWRIEAVTYGDIDVAEKSLDVLRTELLAGNVPDLFCFCDDGAGGGTTNGGVILSKFCMDLLPLLDADPDFGQADFLPSLLEAIKQDGCLYSMPLAFQMTTCKALSALIAEPGVTFAELEQVRAQAGDDWVPFGSWNDAQNILNWTAPFCVGRYVDRETGTCSFDSQEFADLLTWCKTWGRDAVADPNPYEKTILTLFPVQTVLQTVRQTEMWRDGYTYAGIPCYEGNGSMFQISAELGISSRTEHMDGAWAFVHYCLTCQDSGIVRGIPVLESVIRDQVETIVEADSGKEGSIPLYATRADADQFYELLYGTTVVGGKDEALLQIIKEEAEFYFQDSRTVEETVTIIQDRASLYVAEQYG